MTKASVDACRLLLLKAGRLYEKHEAGRPQPFNVFSVLRKETDEVHLHSRFLRALLDYRRSPDRRNLADFLETFLPSEKRHLDPDGARVDREFEHIDILIRDESSRHAVVIEHKIEAGDQPRQLQGYDEKLEEEGYTRRHLFYLTLDGHAASEDSARGLEYRCISYKEDLPPWLQRCQERACDEPELRESIAQYVHLVSKLTGTDQSEEYMTALKALLQEDGNLVLVHDLNAAMTEARIALLCKLWEEIDCRTREEIQCLPERDDEKTDITEARIRRFVTSQRGYRYHGLHYRLGPGSWLGIEVEDWIFYGVWCDRKENESEHDKLKKELEGHGGSSDSSCPWWRYAPELSLRNPTREHLRTLASEEGRRQYVAEVVTGVGELWKRIKGLA